MVVWKSKANQVLSNNETQIKYKGGLRMFKN